MTEYAKIEMELLKHREESRHEIENFLEKEAEETHNEIMRKLQINDKMMIDHHQVNFVLQN